MPQWAMHGIAAPQHADRLSTELVTHANPRYTEDPEAFPLCAHARRLNGDEAVRTSKSYKPALRWPLKTILDDVLVISF